MTNPEIEEADKWYYRVQLQIGVRFDLTPPGISWKEWAFDPFIGLTLPNQILNNPRSQLPKIQHWVDEVGEGRDANNMKIYKWVSRALWFRAGVRILGLDIGLGIAWRKKR